MSETSDGSGAFGFALISIVLLCFDSTRLWGMAGLGLTLTFYGIRLAVVFVHRDRERAEAARRQSYLDDIGEDAAQISSPHLDTLARRRRVLIKVDHYGVSDPAAWHKEVRHFINKVVLPGLGETPETMKPDPGAIDHLIEVIEAIVLEFEEDRLSDDIDIEGLTPEGFEILCCKILTESGWKANLTSATGDQGADVIAQKRQMRLVLQCKLYNSAVGNKAVQEVLAAKAFYGAQIGAVVCVRGYTRAAKQLAKASDIALLTLPELKGFAGKS